MQKANVLSGNVDSRDLHRIARNCSGTAGRYSVSGQNMFIQRLPASRPEFCSSREHTSPLRLSFALVVILTVNARRFQRKHPLSGMGSALNASKDNGVGVIDLVHICGSESMMDAVHATVVGSACPGS